MSSQRNGRAFTIGGMSVVLGGILSCLLGMTVVHGVAPIKTPKYSLVKRTAVRDCGIWKRAIAQAEWEPGRTAVIVCDVWDYHHSINAVRRLEEMLPTMNALVGKLRSEGSIVIHSPSDCMPHYAEHPARQRAVAIPKQELPEAIVSWNCRIEKERSETYPLDQSDGGEDDDPQEHRAWATTLSSLGRNPALPWGSQNSAIAIDPAKDYVSDRGDEVWAILKHHQIEHVVMIGVHTNMCVLGRPFGLRQLVNNGMDVVLVRDLTDCMYNPQRWPYVDHYSGNDLMIAYVEHVVCPTITSDQILGGHPVVFSGDSRENKDLLPHHIAKQEDRFPRWKLIGWKTVASRWFDPSVPSEKTDGDGESTRATFRCSLQVPPSAFQKPVILYHPKIKRAWLNGHALAQGERLESPNGYLLRAEYTFGNDDANVLVIELDRSRSSQFPAEGDTLASPIVLVGKCRMSLDGDWQWNPDPTESDKTLPLPAKFALPPAVYYSVQAPPS
jgi:nicotinamidase-related amidase